MTMGPGIAEVGALVGDPARSAMLAALMDGRALPAGELAACSNIAPQTASFHLGKLLEASLVTVERQGRHKYYRLAGEPIAAMLESLAALAKLPAQAAAHRRRGSSSEMQFARSCYRHLAGRLGVEMFRAMQMRQLMEVQSPNAVVLTEHGQAWCAANGLCELRGAGRLCLDWTERRHHLAGPLGVGLLAALREARWIAPIRNSRAVRLTLEGRTAMEKRLGLRTGMM